MRAGPGGGLGGGMIVGGPHPALAGDTLSGGGAPRRPPWTRAGPAGPATWGIRAAAGRRVARRRQAVGAARADDRRDLDSGRRPPRGRGPRLQMLDRGRDGLGRNPVQDHAVRDLARELQHLGPQGSQDDANRLLRRRGGKAEVLDPVELALEADALARRDHADDLHGLANLLDRWREREPVPVADDDPAREPDSEHDPVGEQVVERRRALAEDNRRARLDRDHRGADVQPFGVARDRRHEGERVVARGLARPCRVVAARLRLAGDGDEFRRRKRGERGQEYAEAGGVGPPGGFLFGGPGDNAAPGYMVVVDGGG